MRMDPRLRKWLSESGFTHAVVIARDVSVCVTGGVESVFRHGMDAVVEAERLSRIYNEEDAFVAEPLAIADTHAKRGDAPKIAAPFMSGGGADRQSPDLNSPTPRTD